jgi:hypothetical protein
VAPPGNRGHRLTTRQAIWLVARREVTERIRDRSFAISILVFVGLIAAFSGRLASNFLRRCPLVRLPL